MKRRSVYFFWAGFLIMSFGLLLSGNDHSQQRVKPAFDASVENPAYEKGKGPMVMYDEGHYNHQKSATRYKGLVDVLMNDGYVVTVNKSRFSAAVLKGYNILIISNALDERNSPWEERGGKPPFYSAFTPEEVEAVQQWVKEGGGLLLVADHFPFGDAAFDLAKRFGVIMDKGLTKETEENNIFTRENGKLFDHPVTIGRNAKERVEKVVTFTGQSLEIPPGTGFMKLGKSAFNVNYSFKEEKSVAGHYLGTAFKYGSGRIVVLGEAGMLCSNVSGPEDGQENKEIGGIRVVSTHYWGMDPEKNDNKKLLINIAHYLSRLLDSEVK